MGKGWKKNQKPAQHPPWRGGGGQQQWSIWPGAWHSPRRSTWRQDWPEQDGRQFPAYDAAWKQAPGIVTAKTDPAPVSSGGSLVSNMQHVVNQARRIETKLAKLRTEAIQRGQSWEKYLEDARQAVAKERSRHENNQRRITKEIEELEMLQASVYEQVTHVALECKHENVPKLAAEVVGDGRPGGPQAMDVELGLASPGEGGDEPLSDFDLASELQRIVNLAQQKGARAAAPRTPPRRPSGSPSFTPPPTTRASPDGSVCRGDPYPTISMLWGCYFNAPWAGSGFWRTSSRESPFGPNSRCVRAAGRTGREARISPGCGPEGQEEGGQTCASSLWPFLQAEATRRYRLWERWKRDWWPPSCGRRQRGAGFRACCPQITGAWENGVAPTGSLPGIGSAPKLRWMLQLRRLEGLKSSRVLWVELSCSLCPLGQCSSAGTSACSGAGSGQFHASACTVVASLTFAGSADPCSSVLESGGPLYFSGFWAFYFCANSCPSSALRPPPHLSYFLFARGQREKSVALGSPPCLHTGLAFAAPQGFLDGAAFSCLHMRGQREESVALGPPPHQSSSRFCTGPRLRGFSGFPCRPWPSVRGWPFFCLGPWGFLVPLFCILRLFAY